MNNLSKKEEHSLSRDKRLSANLVFSTGSKLQADALSNEIKLLNRNDEVQLSIKITEAGLDVSINANELNIHAHEVLNLSSKRINIAAADQLNLHTEGHFVQRVKKDSLTEVEGTNKLLAQVQKITATLGNVNIRANDDVRLDGERVKLNCD